MTRVLVLFGTELPRHDSAWWSQFDEVIAPSALKDKLQDKGLGWIDMDSLMLAGSVAEATKLLRELSLLKTSDGSRLSKSFLYRGYELWWAHYDDLYYKWCVPFTQYKKLLEYLADKASTIIDPATPGLFAYFLDAHGSAYTLEAKRPGLSLGLVLQALLSVPFFAWLIFKRPRVLVYTSDQFDGKSKWDFRMKYIYEELHKKRIPFVEYIRSMETTSVVLRHVLQRRRAVVYSFAIARCAAALAGLFPSIALPAPAHSQDPMERFWWLVSTYYLRDARGDKWGIGALRLILRLTGVRAAIIDAATSRCFYEVLACKTLSIPIVGIMQGATSKEYVVYDFMHDFDGNKTLSVDTYGVWSAWWKEYYTQHSKAYRPEQLHVSGPMRPLAVSESHRPRSEGPLKVLFISEQLAAPQEVLPYLEALLGESRLDVYIKFRPYHDGFEAWLREHRPGLLDTVRKDHVFRGEMQEAVAHCDVVVGSHSTAVLEALLKLRRPLFFMTGKQGDFFDIRSFTSEYSFLADTPGELIALAQQSRDIPEAVLRSLQERYFGDPTHNGSAWVVAEIQKHV